MTKEIIQQEDVFDRKTDENEEALNSLSKSVFEASKQAKEFQKLLFKITTLQKSINELNAANTEKILSLPASSDLKKRNQHNIHLCPPKATNSPFIRFLLGSINLSLYTPENKLQLRDEYNSFKLISHIMYCIFPLVVLFFHFHLQYHWNDTSWIYVLHALWMLYFYISSALRENILLINGSNIHPWWLIHHYCAAAQAVIVLVWPKLDIFQDFIPAYMVFSLFNGLVGNLQNVYHKRREYANRALGKYRSNMDVTYQETIVGRDVAIGKMFMLLVVLLFMVQVMEMGIGVWLIERWLVKCGGADLLGMGALFSWVKPGAKWQDWREELQVLSSGLLHVFMGLGNMTTTVRTIWKKVKKEKMKQGKKQQ